MFGMCDTEFSQRECVCEQEWKQVCVHVGLCIRVSACIDAVHWVQARAHAHMGGMNYMQMKNLCKQSTTSTNTDSACNIDTAL